MNKTQDAALNMGQGICLCNLSKFKRERDSKKRNWVLILQTSRVLNYSNFTSCKQLTWLFTKTHVYCKSHGNKSAYYSHELIVHLRELCQLNSFLRNTLIEKFSTILQKWQRCIITSCRFLFPFLLPSRQGENTG